MRSVVERDPAGAHPRRRNRARARRADGHVATVTEAIYVAQGTSLLRYDPSAEPGRKWLSCVEMPDRSCYPLFDVAVLDNHLYVVGHFNHRTGEGAINVKRHDLVTVSRWTEFLHTRSRYVPVEFETKG
ncbi:hypothetical protein EVAR_34141_1 [Eumeta japonica]|uniref:Uncharacterized protein n=1 Tax=Eumeta variegata TaxID=151549 RepID=A0A4C1WMJ1_EUMVA|nr:hypothetical protein EVAR_34141_1 [Eumeta japonica]